MEPSRSSSRLLSSLLPPAQRRLSWMVKSPRLVAPPLSRRLPRRRLRWKRVPRRHLHRLQVRHCRRRLRGTDLRRRRSRQTARVVCPAVGKIVLPHDRPPAKNPNRTRGADRIEFPSRNRVLPLNKRPFEWCNFRRPRRIFAGRAGLAAGEMWPVRRRRLSPLDRQIWATPARCLAAPVRWQARPLQGFR